MAITLPNDDVLYAALLARDADYEGKAYVGVTSTGVFCCLSCPARKPKRQNCVFFAGVVGCLEAGFRACKRCKPLAAADDPDPTVATLLAALAADPTRRWSEATIAQMGFYPSTVRRQFKRHFGTTFLALARDRRVRVAASLLAGGAQVVDAQLDAGFESASGFRAALSRLNNDTSEHT